MRIGLSEKLKIVHARVPAIQASATSSLNTMLNKLTAPSRNALIALSVGATSGAVLSCQLMECATSGGTYTAVSGGAFSLAGAAQPGIYVADVNLEARLQFLKVRTRAATGGAPIVGVSWILGNANQLPLSQVVASKFSV